MDLLLVAALAVMALAALVLWAIVAGGTAYDDDEEAP
jgi:hypothetical protein